MKNNNAYEFDELEAFAGDKGYHYDQKWYPYPNLPFAGLNFAALFAGAYWFIYRRMYASALVIVGSNVLLNFLERRIFPGSEALRIISLVLSCVVSLVSLCFGNALYRAKFQRALKRLDAEGVTDPDERVKRLKGRGGPWSNGVLILLGSAVVYALVVTLTGAFLR